MVGRSVDLENPAGPPDRDAPLTTNPVHQLAFASRPSELSADHILEHLAVDGEVGDNPLELRILAASDGASRVAAAPSNFFFQLK
jgi:hypothetical protein